MSLRAVAKLDFHYAINTASQIHDGNIIAIFTEIWTFLAIYCTFNFVYCLSLLGKINHQQHTYGKVKKPSIFYYYVLT